ncbi:MAG TPA: hypothetical protein VFI06_17530 [Chitinophagaceae bacterium]|nr:hypothetical protein [Chitinophagaceae bacterium]
MGLGTYELFTILLITFLIFLVPFILFLVTQQNTLKIIQPQNRTMQPGEVWLQLIPLFGLVWQFIVVSKISESIRRELASENTFSFEQQNNPYANNSYGQPKPTYGIGIAYCVLWCCSIIPLLGSFAGIAALICWIIYWVQLSDYKNRIQAKIYSRDYSQSPPR